MAEYEKRVWSLAHHIAGNSEDAREITQEVFLRVYRHLGTYDPRRPFESWLFRIAVNCSWDYLEKRPTHAALDALPSVSGLTARSDPRERPDRVLAGHEVRAALRSLLGLLTPQERTVFILRDVHGLPTREIAFILKCTSITVRRHSSSARLKMRRALAERYPDLLVDRDLE